jgi:hypothetical protein
MQKIKWTKNASNDPSAVFTTDTVKHGDGGGALTTIRSYRRHHRREATRRSTDPEDDRAAVAELSNTTAPTRVMTTIVLACSLSNHKYAVRSSALYLHSLLSILVHLN